MGKLLGISIKNFGLLKNIKMGQLSADRGVKPLGNAVAIIGRSGVGKSTLADAINFLSDCVATDVERACNAYYRGGYEQLVTQGVTESMQFEIHYRESSKGKSMTYELKIDKDRTGRPYVKEECLRLQSKGKRGKSESEAQAEAEAEILMFFRCGKGFAYATETGRCDGLESKSNGSRQEISLTDNRKLGLTVLGNMKGFSQVSNFKDFLNSWYLCQFAPERAKQIQTAEKVSYLNRDGSNLNNIVQYMYREDSEGFRKVLSRLKSKFPNIEQIRPVKMPNGQIILEFKQSNLKEPLYSTQMSDGTLKLLAYYLLLNEKNPRSLVFLAEPEDCLYHTHILDFASEIRRNAGFDRQIFVTTNSPFLINSFNSDDVWVLENGMDGFSEIKCASSYEFVKALTDKGAYLGDLWYNHYFG